MELNITAAGVVEGERAKTARRIVATLFAAQCLGSAGVLAAATVNSIAGEQLTGSPGWATLPDALFQFGVAAAALGWGVGMDRLGWRRGLVLGLSLGGVGGLMATAAMEAGSLGLFLAGLVLMGVANSALRLARFAAAEAQAPEARGRAISNVVMGGAAATFVWAGLSRGVSGLAERIGLSEVTWPYLAGWGLFALAAGVIQIWLRPDPRALGRAEAPRDLVAAANGRSRPTAPIVRRPGVWVAILTMVMSQAVMVAIMVITPLHMNGHAHQVEDIALVISAHVLGMYAFSLVSGRLADHLGRGPVIVAGSLILGLACVTTQQSAEVAPLGLGLFLLGLGWNFCFIGSSSLLADQLRPEERTRVQGFNDLLVGLVSAVGSLASGTGFAALGFGAMGLAGTAAAGALLLLAAGWQARQAGSRRAAAPAPPSA